MENLGKHKDDFMEGFKDGFLRSEAGKVCRWREHTDINDGFKRSIIQHALMKSGGEGDFDIESFAKVLYGPLKKDPNYSLMDIVKTYDIFSKTEFDRIRLMTSQLLKIKAAEKAGNINDPDFERKPGRSWVFILVLVVQLLVRKRTKH